MSYPSIASSAWIVFPKPGSAAGVLPWQLVSRLAALHPAASLPVLLMGGSPGDSFSPCPEAVPCLEAELMGTLRVIPNVSLGARRGGTQRRPVPKCSRGADQLPVHGAHVPLRRGPGADAEGHGWSWGQQVSCSHCSELLSRSQLLSNQHSGSVLFVSGRSAPPSLLLTGFLPLPWPQQDHCSWGCASHHSHALGNKQPRSPASSSQEVQQHRPAWPFRPGAGLSLGFCVCFFLWLSNELSIPGHGPVRSLHSFLQPSSFLSVHQ